jgi:hypothetical protein
MILLKIVGVRGTLCKSVALILSNRQEITVSNCEAQRILGRKRFFYYAKRENHSFWKGKTPDFFHVGEYP